MNDAFGHLAEAFDVGLEVLRVAFDQTRNFSSDPVFRIRIVQSCQYLGFTEGAELRFGLDDHGMSYTGIGSILQACRISDIQAGAPWISRGWITLMPG